jgi:hypothetical protein
VILRAACSLAGATLAAAAMAQQSYPDAAQCAAYWLGRADYAAVSAYLDEEGAARSLGDAFSAAALRLSNDPAETLRFIEDQRPLMTLLVDSYIYDNDRQSREISERLVEGCGELAATLPETLNLP